MRLDMRSGHRRFALGTFEQEVCKLLIETIKEGQTVLDLGANIGYFTLLMAKNVGLKGQVIAFEPLPSVYELLSENISLNNCTQVRAECIAVADTDGKEFLQDASHNKFSFVSTLSATGNIAVTTTSLDSYLDKVAVKKVDFIKIDVEGAEDRVLNGMRKTLLESKPTILVEIHQNDGQKSDTLTYLKQAGYILKRIESTGLVTCDTTARGGHVLAVCPL